MKKLLQALVIACVYTTGNMTLAHTEAGSGIPVRLDRADPAPLYTNYFPVNYNYQQAKADLKNGIYNSGSGISFSAMPFYNRADRGTSETGIQNTNLYDLSGRCNIFGILQTPVPTGYSSTSAIANLLGATDDDGTILTAGTIPTNLLNSIQYKAVGTPAGPGIPYTGAVTPDQFTGIPELEALQNNETENPWDEVIGFLTIPTKYRKYGVRFEISGASPIGVGMSVQIGAAAISQTASLDNVIIFGNPVITSVSGTGNPPPTSSTTVPNAAYFIRDGVPTIVLNPFTDGSTTPPSSTTVSDQQWFQALRNMKQNTTNQLEIIADTIGLSLNDFQKTSFEDLRFELFWRKGFKLDTKVPVLFVPFVSMFGTLDLGDIANPNQLLAMPFGNNGHNSIGGGAGFTLDFVDNFEIGSAMGATSYSNRVEQNMRMPNADNQAVIFPYTTPTRIQPGSTWYISLFFNSYHFEEDLTFYMQYLYVGHNKDKLTLIESDPDHIFKPKLLEGRSIWNSHVANVGLTYDVSPSIAIACGGQIPLKQLNSYRSATFSVSLTISH
jgi:hypothetical protein